MVKDNQQGIIDAERVDVSLSDDNMFIVCGLPTFRISGAYLEFVDKNRQRCAARGGRIIRVKISHLVDVVKSKKIST
jgi:hypothetical protein